MTVDINGAKLKALRRARGLSQTQMGEMVGICRQSVSYWERKKRDFVTREVRFGALRRMLEILDIDVATIVSSTLPTEDAFLAPTKGKALPAAQKAEDMQSRALRREVKLRQVCGAKNRKGKPCRNMSEPERKRCRFHGGKSTGPRTEEGKARIAAAQRAKWASYRANKSLGPK